MSRLALFALTLCAVPAAAASQTSLRVPVSEPVPYGDLNLSTPAGIAALDRRINGAIHRVCNISDSQDWYELMQARECRTDARSEANSQRDLAVLAYRRGTPSVQIAAVAR